MVRIAALVLGAITFAASAEPISLKGLAPGMSKGKLETAYKGLTSACTKARNAPVPTEICGYTTKKRSLVDIPALDTFAGAPVERWLAIVSEDVTTTILVTQSSSDYERVVAALTERWGKPASAKSSTVQNRMGATFDQMETEWRVDGSVLLAKKRGTTVDEMGLYLSTEKYIAESGRDRRETQPKADAKDL